MVNCGQESLVRGEVPPLSDLHCKPHRREDSTGVGDNIVAEWPRTARELGRDPADSAVRRGNSPAGAGVRESGASPSDEQRSTWGQMPVAAQLPANRAAQLHCGACEPPAAGLPHQGRVTAVQCPRAATLSAKSVLLRGIGNPRADHRAE